MKRLFTIILANYLFCFGYSQFDYCNETLKKQITLNIDSLKIQLINKANNDSNFKTPLLIAFSYYPELRGCRIKLKNKSIRTTLNVRPSAGSLLFNSKKNRIYVMRINNSTRDSIITINEVPYAAKIGLFGHEFGHILDYRLKNKLGILKRAFSYLNRNKKEQYEKEVDSVAIERGLGCYLHQWAVFVQYKSDATASYKQFKRNIYMEPSEIENRLKVLHPN
jgi:hypothetical protein